MMDSADHKDFGVFDFMAKVAMASGHGPKEMPGIHLCAVVPTSEPVGLAFVERYRLKEP